MPGKQIERIEMPSREDFFRDYVFQRKPAIITNLFEGQELSDIRTAAAAADAWGDMQIELQEDMPARKARECRHRRSSCGSRTTSILRS